MKLPLFIESGHRVLLPLEPDARNNCFRFLSKTLLGWKAGKRLFNRFTSQRAEKELTFSRLSE